MLHSQKCLKFLKIHLTDNSGHPLPKYTKNSLFLCCSFLKSAVKYSDKMGTCLRSLGSTDWIVAGDLVGAPFISPAYTHFIDVEAGVGIEGTAVSQNQVANVVQIASPNEAPPTQIPPMIC